MSGFIDPWLSSIVILWACCQSLMRDYREETCRNFFFEVWVRRTLSKKQSCQYRSDRKTQQTRLWKVALTKRLGQASFIPSTATCLSRIDQVKYGSIGATKVGRYFGRDYFKQKAEEQEQNTLRLRPSVRLQCSQGLVLCA